LSLFECFLRRYDPTVTVPVKMLPCLLPGNAWRRGPT